MNVQDKLNLAVERHKAGKTAEAEKLYHEILAEQANHADALHLLGLLALQAKQYDKAIEFITRAVELRPDAPLFHANLGVALDESSRTERAIASYERALALNAVDPRTLSNLSNSLRKCGRYEEAVAAARKAIALNGNYADAHANLASALLESGQLDEASDAAATATRLNPKLAIAHHLLGRAMTKKGQTDLAISSYKQAIALSPDFAEAHHAVGIAYFDKGDWDAALAALRRAVELKPGFAEAHFSLGCTLFARGELEASITQLESAVSLRSDFAAAFERLGIALLAKQRPDLAIGAFQRQVELQPGDPSAHNNLGDAYSENADFTAAENCFRKAIDVSPDHAMAHWNLALTHLIRGNYAEAWNEYDWRFKVPKFRLRTVEVTGRTWDGSLLDGRRIVLWNEQGLGDTIQNVRFIGEVARRGGKIVLACRRELVKLFAGLKNVERCLPDSEAMPPHDVNCSLVSLPRVLGTRLESIPNEVPYLSADSESTEKWKRRIPNDGRLKVGLIWANRANPTDRCPPSPDWGVLASVPNVWWCSLQKPIANERTQGKWKVGPGSLRPEPPPGVELTDWTEELRDLSDTAALMENLDLIVCVDTAPAHLAGALGKRVWLLLKYVPDWRWMMDRTDSPWYPTMRLFRQPRPGDWKTPLMEITRQLADRTL
jgi:tetratricopeptide (TPR) repeat protein